MSTLSHPTTSVLSPQQHQRRHSKTNYLTQEARDKLVLDNEKACRWLVRQVSRNSGLNEHDIEDLYSLTIEYAVRASQLYDPSLGIPFGKYMLNRGIRGRLYREVNVIKRRGVHVPHGVDKLTNREIQDSLRQAIRFVGAGQTVVRGDSNSDGDELMTQVVDHRIDGDPLAKFTKDRLAMIEWLGKYRKRIRITLTRREIKVIDLAYLTGINDNTIDHPMTDTEISVMEGVNRTLINARRLNAIRKLADLMKSGNPPRSTT